jgi:hypothetical protein
MTLFRQVEGFDALVLRIEQKLQAGVEIRRLSQR